MIREEDRRKIKEFLGKLECPKGFDCAASGFRYLCRARPAEANCQLICLEEEAANCVFAKPDSEGYACGCPLRCYVAEKLKL